MRVIVSDTSTISNLIVIGKLSLLNGIYQNILIPPAVHAEIIALEKSGIKLDQFRNSTWIEIAYPQQKSIQLILPYSLDLGETEAIALAYEMKADILVIDEIEGRSVAKELGITTTGLIGVLIRAKETGIISSIKDILDELRDKAGFWISENLYQTVLNSVNEK